MRQAWRQLNKWHNEYPELDYLSININISQKQIIQKDFFVKLDNILRETSINSKRLIFDITENIFLENQTDINMLLSEFQKIGITCAIDDFGTGYSSFSNIQNFPVDMIKIDRSFVADMVEDKKSYEIIKSIIQMAQGLGMETIAKGIENKKQLQILQSLKCNYGQGNYLSKPINGKRIEIILKDQAALLV